MRILMKPTRFWGPALVKHRRLIKHLPDFEVDPWETEPTGLDTGDIKVVHSLTYQHYM